MHFLCFYVLKRGLVQDYILSLTCFIVAWVLLLISRVKTSSTVIKQASLFCFKTQFMFSVLNFVVKRFCEQ